MYYPSVARATPPRDPHVQLDEDSTFLIPQELVERLARSAARRRWRGVYGGDPTGLRQAAVGERGAVEGGVARDETPAFPLAPLLFI